MYPYYRLHLKYYGLSNDYIVDYGNSNWPIQLIEYSAYPILYENGDLNHDLTAVISGMSLIQHLGNPSDHVLHDSNWYLLNLPIPLNYSWNSSTSIFPKIVI
jgi:hypothetical protein